MVFYTRALKKALPKKLALAFLLAANGFAAWAENRLHIDNIENLLAGDEIQVSVLMENDEDISAIQTDVILPEGVELLNKYQVNLGRGRIDWKAYEMNGDRIDGHQLNINDGNYRVSITPSGAPQAFVGITGEVFHFTVKISDTMKDGAIIELKNGHFSTLAGTDLAVEGEKATLKLKQQPTPDIPTELKLYASETEMTIHPVADTKEVTISLDNPFEVYSMQARVKLPKGMALKEWGETERALKSDGFNYTTGKLPGEGNIYQIAFYQKDMAWGFLDYQGPVFTFKVTADNDLAAEDQIEVYDVVVGDKSASKSYDVPGVTIAVNNPNAAALPAAQDAIKKAEEDLAAAIASEREDVTGNDKVKAAQQAAEDAVQALKDKIQNAFDKGELDTTDYADEVAAAEEAAKKLVAVADEEEALIDQTAAIKAEQDKKDAIAVPEEVADDQYVVAAEKAAQDAIDALQKAVDDAYAAEELAAFDNTDLVQAAEDAIAKIQPAIDNAQANKAITEGETGSDALTAAIEAAEQFIAENNPDVADDFAGEVQGLKDQIKELQDEIAGKYNNVELTPEDVAPYQTKVAELNDAIEALKDKAAKADATQKKEAADEALAKAENDLQDVLDSLSDEAAAEVAAAVADEKAAAEAAVKALDDLVPAIGDGNYATPENLAAVNEAKAAADAAVEALNDAVVAEKAAANERAEAAANDEVGRLTKAEADREAAVDKAVVEPVLHDLVKEAEDAAKAAIQAVQDIIDANPGNLADKAVAQQLADAIAAADAAIAAIDEAEAAALADKAANEAALAELQAELKQANNKLDNAKDILTTVADMPAVYADAKQKAAELQEAVDALAAELAEKNKNFELTKDGVKDVEQAKIDDLKAKTTALLEEAAKAKTNEAQYVVLNKEVDAVQKALDDAKAEIAALPDVKDNYTAQEQALQDQVDALKAALDAAHDAGTLTYESTIDKDPVLEAIEQLVADAKAAQKVIDEANGAEAKATEDAQAAADKAQTDLAIAAADVDDRVKEAQTVKDAIAAAQAAIDALNDEIEAQKGKMLHDGGQEAVDAKQAAAEEAIAAVKTAGAQALKDKLEKDAVEAAKAQAVAEQAKADALAVDPETEAYEAEAVQEAVAAAKEAIEKAQTYADAIDDVIATLAAVDAVNSEEGQQAIAAAVAAAEQAIKDAEDAIAAAEKAKADDIAAKELAEQQAEAANTQTLTDVKSEADKANREVPASVAENEDVKAAQEALADAVKALEDAINEAAAAKNAADPAVQEAIEALKNAATAATANVGTVAAEAVAEAEVAELYAAEVDAYLDDLVISDPAREWFNTYVDEDGNSLKGDLDMVDMSIAEAKQAAAAVKALIEANKGNMNNDEFKAQLEEAIEEFQALHDMAREEIDGIEKGYLNMLKDAQEKEAAQNAVAEAAATKAEADALTAPAKSKDLDGDPALQETVKAAEDAIAAAKAAADALAEQVAAATEDGRLSDEEAAALEEAKAAAEAAQTAAEAAVAAAEQAQAEANTEAYNRLANDLTSLQAKLDAAAAAVATGCKDVAGDFEDEFDELQGQIDALEDKLEADNGTLNAGSNYDKKIATIEDAIAQLIADATAAQKAYDAKVAANEKAKTRLDQEIDALQAKFDEVADKLANDYSEVADDYKKEMNDIQAEIDALQEQVDDDYAAIKLDENSTIDTKAIYDKLNELLKRADVTAGISAVTLNADKNVKIFTLNGQRIESVVKGQIVVVKYADGSSKKVMVK